MVQHLVKDRLPMYIKNRLFRLLLRLLTGIRAYNELTYIFDALLQYFSPSLLVVLCPPKNNATRNEQFEIMLGKVPGLQTNSVDQMEFRLALHRYLVLRMTFLVIIAVVDLLSNRSHIILRILKS